MTTKQHKWHSSRILNMHNNFVKLSKNVQLFPNKKQCVITQKLHNCTKKRKRWQRLHFNRLKLNEKIFWLETTLQRNVKRKNCSINILQNGKSYSSLSFDPILKKKKKKNKFLDSKKMVSILKMDDGNIIFYETYLYALHSHKMQNISYATTPFIFHVRIPNGIPMSYWWIVYGECSHFRSEGKKMQS